ncbi:hypothetical protein ABPG74_019334 [Tetrahymena malaccensis]
MSHCQIEIRREHIQNSTQNYKQKNIYNFNSIPTADNQSQKISSDSQENIECLSQKLDFVFDKLETDLKVKRQLTNREIYLKSEQNSVEIDDTRLDINDFDTQDSLSTSSSSAIKRFSQQLQSDGVNNQQQNIFKNQSSDIKREAGKKISFSKVQLSEASKNNSANQSKNNFDDEDETDKDLNTFITQKTDEEENDSRKSSQNKRVTFLEKSQKFSVSQFFQSKTKKASKSILKRSKTLELSSEQSSDNQSTLKECQSNMDFCNIRQEELIQKLIENETRQSEYFFSEFVTKISSSDDINADILDTDDPQESINSINCLFVKSFSQKLEDSDINSQQINTFTDPITTQKNTESNFGVNEDVGEISQNIPTNNKTEQSEQSSIKSSHFKRVTFSQNNSFSQYLQETSKKASKSILKKSKTFELSQKQQRDENNIFEKYELNMDFCNIKQEEFIQNLLEIENQNSKYFFSVFATQISSSGLKKEKIIFITQNAFYMMQDLYNYNHITKFDISEINKIIIESENTNNCSIVVKNKFLLSLQIKHFKEFKQFIQSLFKNALNSFLPFVQQQKQSIYQEPKLNVNNNPISQMESFLESQKKQFYIYIQIIEGISQQKDMQIFGLLQFFSDNICIAGLKYLNGLNRLTSVELFRLNVIIWRAFNRNLKSIRPSITIYKQTHIKIIYAYKKADFIHLNLTNVPKPIPLIYMLNTQQNVPLLNANNDFQSQQNGLIQKSNFCELNQKYALKVKDLFPNDNQNQIENALINSPCQIADISEQSSLKNFKDKNVSFYSQNTSLNNNCESGINQLFQTKQEAYTSKSEKTDEQDQYEKNQFNMDFCGIKKERLILYLLQNETCNSKYLEQFFFSEMVTKISSSGDKSQRIVFISYNSFYLLLDLYSQKHIKKFEISEINKIIIHSQYKNICSINCKQPNVDKNNNVQSKTYSALNQQTNEFYIYFQKVTNNIQDEGQQILGLLYFFKQGIFISEMDTSNKLFRLNQVELLSFTSSKAQR